MFRPEQRYTLPALLLAVAVLGLGLPEVLAQTRPAAPPRETLQARPPKGVKNEDRVKIYADRAIYKKKSKLAQALGHVKVLQDNTTIYADEMFYFEEQKQSLVDKGVKIVQQNKKQEKGRITTITAVKMIAFHQEKRIFLEHEVRMDRESFPKPIPEKFAESKAEKRRRTEEALKKERTVITADQMEYFTKTENANLIGNVVVLQKEKKLTGKKAFIRGETEGDTITLEDDAQVIQLNGNWLIENKIIRPDPKDEEQKRLLREKLTINADKITLFRATDDLEATGKVKIVQKVGGKERVATGDQATYSESKQMAVLSGNVRIQRENGDWLTAEKAIFYTDKENFEAIGTANQQVISEFTLDENDQRSSKEPINDPLPDFDLDGHRPAPHLPSWLRKSGKPASEAAPTPVPSKPSPSPQPKATPTPAVPTAEPPKPSARPSQAPSSAPAAIPTPIESSFKIEI
ncbi:hypothetical protein COW20_23020 [bacterium (Candidatus Blackallbacteria) CG13_big_fil_rev_8_21_14_2_50_49_14]|nr:MAG: hypothetical protein COW64_07785 [bacterium (Candidatus Blackallbacteria) CG18_big_fil_WC_8_21_14_2_50_49_26]PIW44740.1 MAG: hypothetical protein COW20_23020 [bacterium (Candidatus Blackallbacteria) CG13_big_fil_rev_8_21_14_2_50_49_14]